MTKLEQLEEDLETLSWCIRELKDLYKHSGNGLRGMSGSEVVEVEEIDRMLIKSITDLRLKYHEVKYSISELKSKENNENK